MAQEEWRWLHFQRPGCRLLSLEVDANFPSLRIRDESGKALMQDSQRAHGMVWSLRRWLEGTTAPLLHTYVAGMAATGWIVAEEVWGTPGRVCRAQPGRDEGAPRGKGWTRSMLART